MRVGVRMRVLIVDKPIVAVFKYPWPVGSGSNVVCLPRRKGPRDCADIELNYAQLTAKNPRGILRVRV